MEKKKKSTSNLKKGKQFNIGVKNPYESVKIISKTNKALGTKPGAPAQQFKVKDLGVKKITFSKFKQSSADSTSFVAQSRQMPKNPVSSLPELIEVPSFQVLKPALLVLIKRTNNNIFFSISYRNGLPLYQTSGGATGIGGSKRDTPASAETAAKLFSKQVLQRGNRQCYLCIDGVFDNTTRAAVRGLQSSGLISFIKVHHSKVVTHNGVRLPKIRRT